MITLDRLVNVLAGSGARLAEGGGSRGAVLRSLVVHDATERRAASGDVFLAVGVDSPLDAVRLGRRARATVVVIRARAPLEATAAAEAREAGIAVLLVDPEVSWSQLTGLAYGLVLEGRETESGRGPTDLFALADAIAADLGGCSVVIEDELSRLLAYSRSDDTADAVDAVRSQTILGRRLPDRVRTLFTERGVFRHLAGSDEPVFVVPSPAHGFGGRMVIAVRAGRQLLGSIWVETTAPFDDAHRRVLEDGARTTALHLLRSRASADLERQVESDLVARLLEGAGDPQAMISQLGLPAADLRVVALQAHVEDEQHAGVLVTFDHVTTGFGWSRPGRSALFANTVYTLLPDGADGVEGARRWVASVRAALPRRVGLVAGVGGAAGPTSLPASRSEADECLALHANRPDLAPVAYDESWDRIVLRRLRAVTAAGRVPERDPVVELRRHDRRHGTHYVPTLRAWLAAHGDIAAAAGALAVHPNTVRYRLRRMDAVTHLATDQPDQRLAMIIALAALDEDDS
ncbi:PucR family transcriptional regulator [Actinomycetospora cinnamomea]|uniref:DNA-binding PucR family transcriptional regulator n=1 Tax=Actinomycetospora cinnamomea TaxID=663609 RepID=A0A2U1EZI2_9PSEU|nr:helix-turn-helix domain-containing protein [Actinomycetospora cinnamomea]PVZ05347.1 DNA-binding PucR family transcriptional regulator [Actinomycetospora cinnamomea]